jgi:peptidase S41-like protein
MALTRLDEPNIYHYDKPVIVLLNGKSFSATDIFLAGLKGMKNVLLLGTPSSGRQRLFTGNSFRRDKAYFTHRLDGLVPGRWQAIRR